MYVQDGSSRIIQGVREIFEMIDSRDAAAAAESNPDPPPERDSVARRGKLVVIGRGLKADLWQQSLDAALE